LSTIWLPVVIRAAPAALIIFALLFPANAQFWGDPWGGRQQQRQYSPFGGFWGDRWGGWGDHRRYPRQRERQSEREQMDYSRAPPTTPRKDAATKIVVMGDANADWLAYGLEDAFSEQPEIGIVRKHRTDSGLIRYDARRDTDWPQVAREIIAAEKPKFIVMMIGNNDRQTIREKAPPPPPRGTPKSDKQPAQSATARPLAPPDPEQQHSQVTEDKAHPVDYGPWEFHSKKWELAYVKRIDATIAVLKSAGVPVIWVGLPSQRNTKSSQDSSYLNELYRSRAEKAGIVYADIWDGFVDESGGYSPQGPDYEGQIRRLRSGDGVYFTKYGARKLAHYVEREIQRIIGNKSMPVAVPMPVKQQPQAAKPGGPAERPLAGPVVPLTAAPVEQDELLGGPRARPAPAGDETAKRVLTNGVSLAAPAGRADDFSWSRDGAVEPVVPEPVVAEPASAPSVTPAIAAARAEQKPQARRRSRTSDAPRRPSPQGLFRW
jgi:uncharacterized protein